MVDPVIKMQCPDDACKEHHKEFEAEIKHELFTAGEHRNGIKGKINRIEALLATRVSKSNLITYSISLLSIGVVIFLFWMSAWSSYKEMVLVNKTQISNNKEQLIIHKDRFEKTDEKLERIQSQQIRMKDDILQAIRELKK